jgi:nitroreductase
MDIYQAIRARRSIRKFQQRPVEREVLARVLEVCSFAPSAKNLQPWRLVVVRDAAIREALVPACRGQAFLAQAPVVLAFCGKEDDAYQTMGGYWNSLAVDLAILLDEMSLAAQSEGLGTCWIGAFREEEVKQVLQIPAEVKVVALTPLGYPDEEPVRRPRKELAEILYFDLWGQTGS